MLFKAFMEPYLTMIIFNFTRMSNNIHWFYWACRQNDVQNEPRYIIYTSGQRYGITTTKCHLREFDRYLLFLDVRSIAERNTVISSIHYVTKSNGQTVGVAWGLLRLNRRKKVSSVLVTWSEVCLAIILPLVCKWGFGKDHWYFFELLRGWCQQICRS